MRYKITVIFLLTLAGFVFCDKKTGNEQVHETGLKEVKKEIQEPELGKGEIRIKADSSVMYLYENKAEFKRNVTADDGSAKLSCDRMEVEMDNNQQPRLIKCFGNVVIRRDQSVSYADKAEYSLADQRAKLIDNAMVVTVDKAGHKRTTRGKVINYDLKKNSIEVKSSEIDIESK